MEWTTFLVLAVAALLISALAAIFAARTAARDLDPFKLLFAGVALCAVFLFLPLYIHAFRSSGCGMIETVLIAVHNMIRLFVVDCDFAFVTEHIEGLAGWQYRAYSVLFSVLSVTAPLMTFGFVLSFFKNASAYRRYYTHYAADTCIFSELNDRSLALAASLRRKNPTGLLLVFTNIVDDGNETALALQEQAKKLGAILFRKSITDCNFSFHSRKSRLTFFAISQDESQNLDKSLELVQTYRDRENTRLYVFSSQREAELLLQNAFSAGDDREMRLRVRRVNPARSFVNHLLYENGYRNLYETAIPDDRGIRRIGAVVFGMGQYGTTMLKALPWFCQMDGYEVRIHGFDMDPDAESHFASQCPELMKPGINGNFTDGGESRYQITIHSAMTLGTQACDEELRKLCGITYVFVALGSDEANIAAAAQLRSLFRSMGISPVIQTVVYNSRRKQALEGICNFKNVPYDIDFVGDLDSTYSEEVILASRLEAAALARHMRWDGSRERDFWMYDYHYGSSVAAAIHYELKKLCKMPGILEKPEDRQPSDRHRIRVVEHCRWNAYMRSEGYSYSGSTDKATRDDMAKRHHCLVTFEKLPLGEQEKDDD